MVKVLQIGMTSNIGGMETYLMAQYRAVNRKKVQYDFINITGEKEIAFANEIRKNGGIIYSVPSRHSNPFIHYYKVVKLLLYIRNNYKFIIYNTCSLNYIFPLFIAKLLGIPNRIIHSHNSGNEIKINFVRRAIIEINKILMNFSVTEYWACSQVAGKFMFGNKKFRIIHNAIDTDEFVFNEAVRQQKRQELGLNDALVIGNVARFSYQKNHEFLLHIFAEILKRETNAKLLLVGDAKGNEEWLKYIKDLANKLKISDKVLFLGLRSDIAELYQAMDCLVMPSRFEGLSVTAIEAQATGLPILCSTAMSRETKITNNMYQLSLDNNFAIWAKKSLDIVKRKRRNMKNEIINSGYDINTEINKIQQLFIG